MERIQNKTSITVSPILLWPLAFAALLAIATVILFASTGPASSFLGDTVADRVFGQGGSFTTNTCNNGGVSAVSLCGTSGVALDASGNLYVADFANNRVLEYNSPLTTDMVADRVFGQGNFTSNGCGTSATTLCQPRGLALDTSGNLYVADFGNNRVLEYNSPLTTDAVADRVFGQPNFTSGSGTFGCNQGMFFRNASTLCFPGGVGLDGSGNLYVADTGNSRVLEYNTPLTTDAVADRVFGQPDFGGQTGTGCNSVGLSASSLCRPAGVVVDASGNLFVADYLNHRVLEYNTPITTDAVADRVFGQGGSFTTNTCNNGGVSASSLCDPSGLALDASGNLFVADSIVDDTGAVLGNHRVLEYNAPLSTDTVADRVFGQGGSFTTNTCNNGGISAGSLCAPEGVALDASGNLFVGDHTNNRALEYDAPLATPTTSPTASQSPTASPTPVFTSAMGFRPSSSSTLTVTPPGANPDTTTTFNIPSPDSVASSLHADGPHIVRSLGTTFVDGSFTIANDAAITNGATVGNAEMLTSVGLANSACNSIIAISISVREADTSTTDTIAPAGPAQDPEANLVADNRGANPGDPPNGLPDYLDATPTFNNPIFTVAGGGPVTPRARYAGHALLAGVRNFVLQIALFEPGGLSGVPNGGWAQAGLGYPAVAITLDPTTGPINLGGNPSDVCSALNSTIVFCGRTDSAPGTAGCQTDVSSQTRLTNPAGPRTVQTIVQARSLRDHDNDGIENQLDSCPFTNSSAWNPRASGPNPADPEDDGLPNDCDPAPGTFNTDQDGDGWQNRVDNCPLITNALGQLDQDIASNQPVPDGGPRSDGIGAACDPNATSPNGLYRRTAIVHRSCITANAAVDDTDADGVCETGPAGTITDPNDSNTDSDGDGVGDRTDDCISVANPPPAGVTQTDYDMDAIGDPCDTDLDGDGWTNAGETGSGNIGTDAIDPCADGPLDDAWPPDLNNDTFADISDVSLLTGQFSDAVPPALARHDIAPDTNDSPPGPDNFIDITDISRATGLFGASCATLWGTATGPP